MRTLSSGNVSVVLCLFTLTGRGSWTGLTRLVPGFPHVVGAAAHLLRHVEGQLVHTRVVVVSVTHTLPHVCITKRWTVHSIQKLKASI